MGPRSAWQSHTRLPATSSVPHAKISKLTMHTELSKTATVVGVPSYDSGKDVTTVGRVPALVARHVFSRRRRSLRDAPHNLRGNSWHIVALCAGCRIQRRSSLSGRTNELRPQTKPFCQVLSLSAGGAFTCLIRGKFPRDRTRPRAIRNHLVVVLHPAHSHSGDGN